MRQTQSGTFRNPGSLTTWVKWLLYAMAAMAAVAIVSGVMERQLLTAFQNGVYTSAADVTRAAEVSDARQRVVGVIQTAIFIATGVLILIWIHRANVNARALGATGMNFTPGWSVGWYFVPFANLVKPFQAMREIWLASEAPGQWSQAQTPGLLRWWWFLWLAESVTGNLSFRLSMNVHGLDEAMLANAVTIASDLVTIPLCFVLATVITDINAFQISRNENAYPAHVPA